MVKIWEASNFIDLNVAQLDVITLQVALIVVVFQTSFVQYFCSGFPKQLEVFGIYVDNNFKLAVYMAMAYFKKISLADHSKEYICKHVLTGHNSVGL